MIHIFM